MPFTSRSIHGAEVSSETRECAWVRPSGPASSDESTVSSKALLPVLLDHLARCPQGLARLALQEALENTPLALFDEAVAQAADAGWIEPSPLYPERLRWARADGPFETAAAWVRLRTAALPFLAEIHRLSTLPTTLHVLFGQAELHAPAEENADVVPLQPAVADDGALRAAAGMQAEPAVAV